MQDKCKCTCVRCVSDSAIVNDTGMHTSVARLSVTQVFRMAKYYISKDGLQVAMEPGGWSHHMASWTLHGYRKVHTFESAGLV